MCVCVCVCVIVIVCVFVYLSIYFQQIHTFYRSCNRRASCNCAVAVRVDDDVVVIDRCGPSMGMSTTSTPITVKMYVTGELTPGLRVIRINGGKKYAVSICHVHVYMLKPL